MNLVTMDLARGGVRGYADCLAVHRPPATLIEFSGNRQVLSGFEPAIAPGIS
jgi:hypothetical protein